MERQFKKTPPRLAQVFSSYNSPVYFVTFNVHLRQRILARPSVHEAFRDYAGRGLGLGVEVGRYVLMPDHVHAFVGLSGAVTLSRWMQGLKRALNVPLEAAGHEPSQIPGQTLRSFWQPGGFDHLLRREESYEQKWHYVRENPVRAGLVERVEDWPFQGEVHRIDRV